MPANDATDLRRTSGRFSTSRDLCSMLPAPIDCSKGRAYLFEKRCSRGLSDAVNDAGSFHVDEKREDVEEVRRRSICWDVGIEHPDFFSETVRRSAEVGQVLDVARTSACPFPVFVTDVRR